MEITMSYYDFLQEQNRLEAKRKAGRRNLQPHGIQKSFYGKAKIDIVNGLRCLFSYGTLVAFLDREGNLHRTWGGWSMTTSKHVNAFCREYDTCGICKREWDAMPVEARPE